MTFETKLLAAIFRNNLPHEKTSPTEKKPSTPVNDNLKGVGHFAMSAADAKNAVDSKYQGTEKIAITPEMDVADRLYYSGKIRKTRYMEIRNEINKIREMREQATQEPGNPAIAPNTPLVSGEYLLSLISDLHKGLEPSNEDKK